MSITDATGSEAAVPDSDTRLSDFGAEPSREPRRRLTWDVVGILLLVSAVAATYALLSYNISIAPDIVWDEVVYSRAGSNVLLADRLAWDASPIAVHPPLFFLMLANWISLGIPEYNDAIGLVLWARYLTNISTALMVMMVGVLVLVLLRRRGSVWRLAFAALAMAIVMVDPIVQRYGRLLYIDSVAILLGLAVVVLSIVARERIRRSLYVLLLGGLIGVALLTKELAILYVAAPTLAGVLARDKDRLRTNAIALGLGVAIWSIFPLWAILIGSFSEFIEQKSITLLRVGGLLQTTGWNREGLSLFDAIAKQSDTYGATYLLFMLGGVAMLWSVYRAIRWRQQATLASLMVLTFGFTGYSALAGQANEHFSMYAVVTASIGCVVFLDAVRVSMGTVHTGAKTPRATLRIVAAFVATGLVITVLLASVSWVFRYSSSRDDGLMRMARYIDTEIPACSVVNVSGDVFKYRGLLGPDRFADFSNGPRALGYGVSLFLVSPVDADRLYGNMTPQLADWIRRSGDLVVEFEGETYGGLSLYEVPTPWNDSSTEIVGTEGGLFTNTIGSACGGYLISDTGSQDATASFFSLGGKAVLGRARSAVFAYDGHDVQLFDAALVRLDGSQPSLAPIVEYISDADPHALTSAGVGTPEPVSEADIDAGWVWGRPIGPVVGRENGETIQAFENGVLRRNAEGRLEPTPVADLAIEAGLVPPDALITTPVPGLLDQATEQSAPASVFIALLVVAVGVLVAAGLVVLQRRT